MKDPSTGAVYIVAEARLDQIPGAVPKPAKKGGAKKGGGGAEEAPPPPPFEVLARLEGRELVGRSYAPLFPYYAELKAAGAFRVCGDAYVTSDSGTGIVHQAPAFGEDDYRVCLAHGAACGQHSVHSVRSVHSALCS